MINSHNLKLWKCEQKSHIMLENFYAKMAEKFSNIINSPLRQTDNLVTPGWGVLRLHIGLGHIRGSILSQLCYTHLSVISDKIFYYTFWYRPLTKNLWNSSFIEWFCSCVDHYDENFIEFNICKFRFFYK